MTISELYPLFLSHPVVTTDSRNCPPGALFFALKGDRFNGHDFVEKALQAGCAYAIVEEAVMSGDKRIIVVDNVLITLQQLAHHHRKTLQIPVIGITGSNGKTTTKELTAAVLAQKYKTLFTVGNLNNHIGVPLTLLRLTNEHEIAVIEMGANHPGEIGELSAIVAPDYGLITNVGYAHLEGFGSFEGVIKTKGELYDYIRKTDGTVFIHQDNHFLTTMAEGIKQIAYGAIVADDENSNRPFIGGKITNNHPFLSFVWQCGSDAVFAVDTRLVGGYNLWNALAAITIGVVFKIPYEKINEALANYEPSNNRSQLHKTSYNELIIDAYNANPSSMQAAIDNFASSSSFPKAVILGDMLELGEKSIELHTAIIKQIESCRFENVLLCGEHFSITGKKYTYFPTVEALAEYLEANPLQGYHVLIKGSRGIRLEQIIRLL